MIVLEQSRRLWSADLPVSDENKEVSPLIPLMTGDGQFGYNYSNYVQSLHKAMCNVCVFGRF